MQTSNHPSKSAANRQPPGRPPAASQATQSRPGNATPPSPVHTYFAILRLADAIPQERFAAIRAEAEAANQSENGDEATLRRRIAQALESELDAFHGDCWLRDEQVAQLVQSALQAGHGRRYTLRAWSILPNHLLVVFTVGAGVDAGGVVREWRAYTTSQVNLALDRGAVELWERMPYLRPLQDDADVLRRIKLVEWRPVNAHLCRKPRDWKWGSAHASAPPANPNPRGARAPEPG